jgi:hypothetical protein
MAKEKQFVCFDFFFFKEEKSFKYFFVLFVPCPRVSSAFSASVACLNTIASEENAL